MCRKLVSLLAITGLLIPVCCQNSQESISDYFPMKEGTMWHYEIEIGQEIPFISHTVLWPDGKGKVMVVETSGLYFSSIEGKVGKKYQLVLRVVSKASEEVPLDYKEGVKLKIEKDELGVYGNESILLWLIPNTSQFMVDETVLLSVESQAAPPAWYRRTNEKYGFYYQTMFYEGKEGSKINHGEQSPAELQFISQKDDHLSFVRSFGSSSRIEVLWFKKGKGLVRLQQRIDGKISMTWNLLEFVQGK